MSEIMIHELTHRGRELQKMEGRWLDGNLMLAAAMKLSEQSAQQEPVPTGVDAELVERLASATPEQLDTWLTAARRHEARKMQPAQQAAQQQEPVAVVSSVVNSGDKGVRVRWLGGFPQIGDRLYTSPPAQRKPLPKGEWPKHPSPYVDDQYIGYAKSDLDDYATQVLAAHGIKE